MRIGLNTSIVGGSLTNPFAAYAIGGQTPQTIADFEADKYRANGTTATASSLLTHTRAGTATYTDSTGTLQTAASGELRKDNHIWDGSSWVKRCLVEPQSTNLFIRSDEFDNAAWITGTNANSTRSDGSITINASGGYGYLRQTNTLSGQYTTSFYAVSDIDASSVGIRFADNAGGASKVVNFVAGVPQLITLTRTISSSTYCEIGVDMRSGVVPGVSTESGFTITFSRAQLEASSVPTSYIPTAGSQVTRPADALSIDSTLLPYDSTAMTIAMEYNVTGDDGTLFNWEADASNKITASVASGAYTFTQIEAGTSDSVTGGTLADGTNTAASAASRHTDGDINAAIDGTALTVNSTVTALADLSASDFVIAPSTALNIKTVRILGGYGADDAELEAAT